MGRGAMTDSDETCDLVPETLGGDDGDFLHDTLVRIEVQSQSTIGTHTHTRG